MTDTEAKALAIRASYGLTPYESGALHDYIEATEARHAAELREQAERFSEAVERVLTVTDRRQETHAWRTLSPFILPAPDPLVEVVDELWTQDRDRAKYMADQLHKYLAARGGRIVWEGE